MRTWGWGETQCSRQGRPLGVDADLVLLGLPARADHARSVSIASWSSGHTPRSGPPGAQSRRGRALPRDVEREGAFSPAPGIMVATRARASSNHHGAQATRLDTAGCTGAVITENWAPVICSPRNHDFIAKTPHVVVPKEVDSWWKSSHVTHNPHVRRLDDGLGSMLWTGVHAWHHDRPLTCALGFHAQHLDAVGDGCQGCLHGRKAKSRSGPHSVRARQARRQRPRHLGARLGVTRNQPPDARALATQKGDTP
jgi:hypothetical protein